VRPAVQALPVSLQRALETIRAIVVALAVVLLPVIWAVVERLLEWAAELLPAWAVAAVVNSSFSFFTGEIILCPTASMHAMVGVASR